MKCSYEAQGWLGLQSEASSQNEVAIFKIISRAIAPSEQSAGNNEACEDENFSDEAQRLIERWEQLARLKTGGDSRAFTRRLNDLGLTQSSVVEWLEPRLLDLSEPLPGWALLAAEVLRLPAEPMAPPTALTDEFSDIEREFLRCDPRRNLPLFPMFLSGFVDVFLRRLTSSVANLGEWICQSALDQIARSLLVKLSAIAARTVAHEVKQRLLSGTLRGDSPAARFQAFESQLASTAGRMALFESYPVLLRLLATVTLNTLDALVEMLTRLRADGSAIADLLGISSGHGLVRSVIDGLSDPHQKGRTVCLLEFADGARLIYKPRSVAIDVAYAQFLKWFNSRTKMLPLRCAHVVAREGYGWCEFVHASECRNREETARYFRRQGMHVAILHFLCGNDFHEGNFIADGEWPVPIDLEGLLTASSHVPPNGARDLPSQLFPLSTTVTLTSLLPRWYAGAYGTLPYSSSGIDGPAVRVWPMRKPLWQNLGTDQMRLTFHYFGEPPDCSSRPRLDGVSIGVESYLDEVLEGFRQAYAAILQLREELLRDGAMLDSFRGAPNRTIFRDSREYDYLLFWVTSPDLLKSGAAHEIALEMLGTAGRDPAVVKNEKCSLWQRDIPHFSGLPSSLDLRIGEHAFSSGLESSSFEQMIERFRSASEEQLEWQAEITEKSFRMSLPERVAGKPSRSADKTDLMVKQAIAFGDALEALRIKHRLGCSWLSLYRPEPASPNLELMHPQPWMTAGAAGTALFLAALARVSGENHYADLAKSALGFTFETFELCSKHLIDKGLMQTGLNGAGLVIYSLSSCARILQDQHLSQLAFRAALMIPLGSCRSVRNPDVLNGAAGLLLAVLALYRQHPVDRLLDRARELAAGIVDCQEQGDAPAGWTVPGMHRPLLGMAHGAAGIAMALWRLHQIDGDRRWSNSAHRGLEYEREFFDAKECDWPNLQLSLETPQFMTWWCAGAPGIGLARLSMREVPDSAIGDEIEAAIAATVRHLGSGAQHLCCGEAGRIVFLETAARMLNRPELKTQAKNAALGMVDAYAKCGFWKLQHFCERNIVPGLLDGISGIGLALLQVAAPESTPNILTME